MFVTVSRKKYASFLARTLVALTMLAFVLSACSSSPDPVRSDQDKEKTMPHKTTLVVYFSNTGATEGVAEKLAALTDADLFEIEPSIPYGAEDLDYNDDDARCMRELNDPAARPEIANAVEDWDDYKTVFIGYPIWWSRTPPIMQTFVEGYDWQGKTVVPFCTSGSSPIGQSARVLADEAPGSTWLSGKRFARNVSDTELEAWLEELDIQED